MKPKHFVILAILAVVSSVAAIASYAANNTWSQGRIAGARLFPSLVSNASKITALELRQGPAVLTMERKDGAWRLKERDGYPVIAEKVRALMVSLAEADLVDAKTRLADRYTLIDLEDPATAGTKSRSVRLLDGSGGVLAETVVGKKRSDAFGPGKAGTYVRKPGDPQTWLANADIDASTDIKDWIKTEVFQGDASKLSRITVEVPGEQPLKFERTPEKKLTLTGIPAGQKLKEEGAPDAIARAASAIDMEDVRKLAAAPAGNGVSTVRLESEGGLVVTLRLRKDGGAQWLSLDATGSEGDAKKTAEEINGRTSGWEFKIPAAKADSILKRRTDLLDKAA